MAEVGYVGLGVMGSAIVRRLLDGGEPAAGVERSRPAVVVADHDDAVERRARPSPPPQRTAQAFGQRAARVDEVAEHAMELRRAGADAIIARPFAAEGGSIEETIVAMGAKVWPRVTALLLP